MTALFEVGQPATVHHLKPWRRGRPVRMRGIVSCYDGHRLVVQRNFRSPGLPYDGLPARQEPGDHGTIELERGSWISRRRYLRSDGTLIGELLNIQTPTRYSPGEALYVDLEVDVALLPDAPFTVEIQDVDDLERAVARNHIPPEVGSLAMRLAEKLAERLKRWDGESPLDWDLAPSEEEITDQVRDFLSWADGLTG